MERTKLEKKQRMGCTPKSRTPEEIKTLAAGAWRYNYDKLVWIDSKTRKEFVQKNGRKFLDLSRMVQDLHFKFETYSPPPKKVNGVPFWEKVVPYNACYLPQGDGKVDHKVFKPSGNVVRRSLGVVKANLWIGVSAKALYAMLNIHLWM